MVRGKALPDHLLPRSLRKSLSLIYLFSPKVATLLCSHVYFHMLAVELLVAMVIAAETCL